MVFGIRSFDNTTFNFTFRYIDDFLLLINSKFDYYAERIYPIEWETKDTTDTVKSTSYLDLYLIIYDEGRLKTKLYHKRDDFSFQIVNFSFLWSNISASPAYRVYVSQLIRYSRACISYHAFLDRGLLLTRTLLNQEFQMVKLKFYKRHHELVDCYEMSVSQIISDMFDGQN